MVFLLFATHWISNRKPMCQDFPVGNQASALALPYKVSPSLFFIFYFLFFFIFFFLQCSNAKCVLPSKIKTSELGFMKFGTGVHLDNTKVDPENGGHRSKVKVARFQKVIQKHTMSQSHVQPVLKTYVDIMSALRNTLKSLASPWTMTIHYMEHCTDLLYVMCMAKVQLPPMNKFACKLHGYIVYLSFIFAWHS